MGLKQDRFCEEDLVTHHHATNHHLPSVTWTTTPSWTPTGDGDGPAGVAFVRSSSGTGHLFPAKVILTICSHPNSPHPPSQVNPRLFGENCCPTNDSNTNLEKKAVRFKILRPAVTVRKVVNSQSCRAETTIADRRCERSRHTRVANRLGRCSPNMTRVAEGGDTALSDASPLSSGLPTTPPK